MIEVNYDVFKPESVHAAPRFAFQWLKNEDLDNLDYTLKKMADFLQTAKILQKTVTPDFFALGQIVKEIDAWIWLGFSPLTALTRTATQLGIPYELCLLASQMYNNCQYNYEKYSFYLVILILERLGFGPVQTARLMNKVADCQYNERTIKELLYAKNNLKPLEYFKKELDNFITNSNLKSVKDKTKQLLRTT